MSILDACHSSPVGVIIVVATQPIKSCNMGIIGLLYIRICTIFPKPVTSVIVKAIFHNDVNSP